MKSKTHAAVSKRQPSLRANLSYATARRSLQVMGNTCAPPRFAATSLCSTTLKSNLGGATPDKRLLDCSAKKKRSTTRQKTLFKQSVDRPRTSPRERGTARKRLRVVPNEQRNEKINAQRHTTAATEQCPRGISTIGGLFLPAENNRSNTQIVQAEASVFSLTQRPPPANSSPKQNYHHTAQTVKNTRPKVSTEEAASDGAPKLKRHIGPTFPR